MRQYGSTNVAEYASAPSVDVVGSTYYNTADKRLYVSDGTAWQPHDVPAGGTAAQLLAKIDGNDWATQWIGPLGSMANQASSAVSITGGSITGITDLAIADGGTGASAKLAAFDNLAPTATRGDLIVRDASNNVRLGLGASGTILRSDGSDAGWATLATAGIQAADQDLTDIAALTRTRGALMVGGTSAWTALTVGGAGTVLRSDGTDAAWASLATAGIQAADQDLTDIAGLTRTQGDLLIGGASAWTRLGIGANTTVLQSNGTTASWVALSGLGLQPSDQDLTDIAALTRARGDLIVGGASAWTRLPISATAGSVLRSNGTDLAYVQDLALPPITSAHTGSTTGGYLSASQLNLAQSYTQTGSTGAGVVPGGGVGVGIKIVHSAILDDTGIFGPAFAHGDGGLSGPNGIVQLSGYVTFNRSSSALSFAPIGFNDQTVTRSKAGQSQNMTPAWGNIEGKGFVADGGTVTLNKTDTGDGDGSYIDNWIFYTVNGGHIDGVTNNVYHRGFVSYAPAMAGDMELRGRIAFEVMDPIPGDLGGQTLPALMGGGTIDSRNVLLHEQYGLRIPRLTAATDANYGISCNSKIALWSDTNTFTTNPEDGAIVRVSGTHTLNVPSNLGGLTAFVVGGTWKVAQATSAFGALGGFAANPVIASDGTASGTLISANSIFTSAATYRADTTSVTMSSINSFRASPTFERTGSGALTVTTATAYEAAATVSSGATVTTLRGLHVGNPNVGASIGTNYGILIDQLTRGTLNYGIVNASSSILSGGVYGGTAASDNLLLKSTTDTAKGFVWLQDPFVKIGTASAYTLTSGNIIQFLNDQDTTMNASGGAGGTGNAWFGIAQTPQVTFAQDGNTGFASVGAFSDQTTVTNSASVALSSVGSYNAAPTVTVTGVGATMSIASWAGFNSSPTFNRFINGTMTVTDAMSFRSIANVGASVTVTNLYGLRVFEPTNAGTITNQYGVYIPTLIQATNNYGLFNASRSVLNGTVAGDTGASGNLTLTSTFDTTKGTIFFDNPLFEFGVSAFTYGGATDYAMAVVANAITMSGTGGAFANGFLGFYVHPTVTYTAAGNGFGGGVAYSDATTYQNASGSTTGNPTAISSFSATPTLTANAPGATITVSSATGFSSKLTLARVTNGNMTVTNHYHFRAIGDGIPVNTTITTRTGFSYQDASGVGGTFTNQYAIDIPALSAATTVNVGIRNAASLLQSGAATLSGTNTLSGATTVTGGLTVTTADVTITDRNVVLSTGTGTKIGTAVGQKLGFYNATPIVQPSSANQAAAPAGGTGATAGAYDTAAHRDSLIALVNEMRNVLVNLGLMKGSA